jgi:hypothetical protein
MKPAHLILAYFLSFLRKKSRLMRSPCCLCIHHYQFFDACTNLYETWYVYHGIWAHLNSILHKSLSLVRVCVSPTVAWQRLVKNVTAATNTQQ